MGIATLERPSSLACWPRWGTRKDPDRTVNRHADALARIAAALGTPLMPWQRHVIDVALEVDPDTKLLAYQEVVLTVPRQSGKTTLLLALMVHRALGFDERQRIVYTAQTRLDARKKWEDEHLRLLEQSQLRGMFKARRQLGQEAIRWRNGSIHTLQSSTEKSGHGETLDLGVIDEAFAQEDARLEQALKPTTITRPQPQLWVVSTAGTARSIYLREKVEAGRLRCEAGVASSVAYFEWSAPPDSDPEDPQTWRDCMPALGPGLTVREDAVRNHFETMKLPEFRRAYLNQWQDETPDEWQVISRGAWSALMDSRSQPTSPFAFAADMTWDRSSGAIAIAGERSDSHRHVEIIDAGRRGTDWIPGRLIELNRRHNPCAVVVDAAGPAGALIAPLEAAGVEVVKPNARQAGQACGQFYDSVTQGTLRHLDQPALASALAGAQKRPIGDAWGWARKGLSVDISPLVAATLALWGHATRAHLTPKPYDLLESIW